MVNTVLRCISNLAMFKLDTQNMLNIEYAADSMVLFS